jgi:NAD(P)-dependent dehydrogenase (short-subunit alcohol dehydrogenase family)
MQNNPAALVTGANKGIGLQIAKDLAARGFTELVGSRNLEHGSRPPSPPRQVASSQGLIGRWRNHCGR